MQGLEGGTESVLSRTRRSSQAFEDQAQTALLRSPKYPGGPEGQEWERRGVERVSQITL